LAGEKAIQNEEIVQLDVREKEGEKVAPSSSTALY
jgi:hypothetical protein